MKGRDAVTADKTSVYARRFRVLAAAFLLLFFASFLLGRFAVAPGTLFRILCAANNLSYTVVKAPTDGVAES